jgi:hypothetical protein
LDFKIDSEKTKLYEPLWLTAKFPVDAELVLRCQKAGDSPHKGTRIGKMMELYPYGALKRVVVGHTKTFLRHMKAQGYIPQQAETEMELWGPFRERVDMSKGAELINIEEGNHTIPEGRYVSAARAVWGHDGVKGPRKLDRKTLLDHRDWQRGVFFSVRGRFLATKGKQEEETGTIIV